MTEELHVLVRDDAAAVADALDAREDVGADVVDAARVDGATLGRSDCLVVGNPELSSEVVDAVRGRAVPVVAVTDAADDVESVEWLDGVVRRDRSATELAPDAVEAILAEIRRAIDHETRLQLRGDRDRMAEVTQATASFATVHDPERLYGLVVDVAGDILAFDGCWIGVHEDRVDGDVLVNVATRGEIVVDELAVEDTAAGRALRTGESHIVSEIDADPDADPTGDWIRSGLSVPLGEYGVFQAGSREPAAFDEIDLELTELLCRHATGARRRLEAEANLRERRERVTALHEGTAELAASRSREKLCERAVEIAADVLSFDQSYLYVADDEAGEFHPAAVSVDAEPPVVPIDHGLMARSRERGESYLVEHVDSHPIAADSSQYESAMSVPIGEDYVLQVFSDEPAAFDGDDLEAAELLCSYLGGALDRIDAERERREEHDRLDALFENVPDAALEFELVDREPIVRRVNSAFEEQFGYDAETVAGHTIDEFIVPPEGSEEADDLNRQLVAGENLRTEVERLTADGPRHFLLHVVPIQLGATNVAGYAIYTDVTERKRRERELRKQNERLDEFASVVSHDLRNPLNVATGYVDIARDTGDTGKLDRAADALDRMESLLTDLLTLAREGAVVGETGQVALDDAAANAWASVDTEDAAATLAQRADGVVLEADEERLCELLENLFHNAIEHGGSDVTIEVGELNPGDGPGGFYVADDGAGIDEDIDPFETGVTTSEDGTGFGLAIVRRIAEAHDWAVGVEESESGGARFEFLTE